MWNRRDFLKSALVASLPPLVGGCDGSPRWIPSAYRKTERSRVAVLGAPGYESPLVDTVLRGIRLFDLKVSGKTVVLKPNFVEFDTAGVINTDPAVIAAAIEAFLTLGAREGVVAEGAGSSRTARCVTWTSITTRCDGLGWAVASRTWEPCTCPERCSKPICWCRCPRSRHTTGRASRCR
jgi:hypothetical protein